MPLYEMRKFVVPEFIFGVGSRHRVGYYARNLQARKVLIVSDPGVMAAGWAGEAQRDLADVGIESVLFHALTPNPKNHEVMAGAEHYQREQCDVIVAVGGGSVMDCAKGIGIVHSNQREILSFEGVDQVGVPGPPLICIPTTAGTAADISQFCIIMNRERRRKISIISKSMVPDVALIDPETTSTMDPHLAACTGIDALTHAIEAFVSTASSPVTDVHALAAIELVSSNIEAAAARQGGIATLEKMMLGSLHAGLAFSNASLGAVHAMAHSLGGYLDLPHGECNALVLEHVVEFNLDSASDRYEQIGKILGIDTRGQTRTERCRRLIETLRQLRQRICVADNLSRHGIRSVDLSELASHAYRDVCLVTNPRRANLDDLKAIYGEAL